MNILYRLYKQRHCKHNDTCTITNLYGDYIYTSPFGKVYRSIKKCNICGSKIYSEELDPSCDIINYGEERL